jgi:hypothetical protein
MTGGRLRGMLARGLTVALLAGVALHLWPGAWLVPSGRLAGVLVQWTCPWLDQIFVHAEGTRLLASGRIQVDMIQADGSPLPSVPGSWSKQAVEALGLAVVALAAWAAVPAGRRRWMVLPIVLASAVLASAVVLSVEILDAALEGMAPPFLLRRHPRQPRRLRPPRTRLCLHPECQDLSRCRRMLVLWPPRRLDRLQYPPPRSPEKKWIIFPLQTPGPRISSQ